MSCRSGQCGACEVCVRLLAAGGERDHALWEAANLANDNVRLQEERDAARAEVARLLTAIAGISSNDVGIAWEGANDGYRGNAVVATIRARVGVTTPAGCLSCEKPMSDCECDAAGATPEWAKP